MRIYKDLNKKSVAKESFFTIIIVKKVVVETSILMTQDLR